MYGTIARLRLKPGVEEQFKEYGRRQMEAGVYPDIVSQTVYRLDRDANEYMLAVVFTSKEAYVANAQSPEQHARYLEMRAFLDADPEWLDGEVIQTFP